jgi:uncharacterized membrane protein
MRETATPLFGVVLVGTILSSVSPARADLRLCNRTSYVLDQALGLEEKGAVATRGWFRVDPGQCRGVLAGAIDADQVYVFARALELYGSSPLPQAGHVDLCVADGNFVIAGARSCAAGQRQRFVRFTAVKPTAADGGLSVNIAEQADYDAAHARLAGIQRLLAMAGYDIDQIDGAAGAGTEVALAAFLKARKLPPEAATDPAFFDLLREAARLADGVGLTWCNDTGLTVMAALAVEDGDAIVTRGWYRVEPGACLKPDVAGQSPRVFSFAEAVDRDGLPVRRDGKPLSWGGSTMLCTRPVRFELNDHSDCAAKGLNTTGFAAVERAGRGGTVRFQESQ